MKRGFKPIGRDMHQHIPDVADDGVDVGERDGGPDVAVGKRGRSFAAGTDLQARLSRTLE